jgi:hypothetical protein
MPIPSNSSLNSLIQTLWNRNIPIAHITFIHHQHSTPQQSLNKKHKTKRKAELAHLKAHTRHNTTATTSTKNTNKIKSQTDHQRLTQGITQQHTKAKT